jgi:hypothetical protein
MRRDEALHRIDTGIANENAQALGRAGERLEAARVRALHARLALLIQREAAGLRRHRIVDQQFPEPPRRSPGRYPARA